MIMVEDDLEVRSAEPNDADALFRMAGLLATSAVPERTAFDHALTAILADPAQCLLVIGSNACVYGYLYGLTHPSFHANGNVGWIEELFVDEAGRGTGAGRALMTAFEEWAIRTSDARYFAVATRRAGDFYRAVGYAESAGYFKKVSTPGR
jgi:GNAT superfamily N-acetyltransferase